MNPNEVRFHFDVNEAEVDEDGNSGSVTRHIVYGTQCARSNKRRIRAFLKAYGVPVYLIKSVMKEMGFWGARLGGSNVQV